MSDPDGDVTGGWIHTRSGHKVWPLDGRGVFTRQDVMYALAGKARWTAHAASVGGRRLSVLNHEIVVAQLMIDAGEPPEVVMAGLHHDDGEAYLPDVSSPTKPRLFVKTDGGYEPWSSIEDRVLRRILVDAWDLPADLCEMHHDTTKRYDKAALRIEAEILMHGTEDWSAYVPSLDGMDTVVARRMVSDFSAPDEAIREYIQFHNLTLKRMK